MTTLPPDNDTYRRILDEAEAMFAERGYKSVTLRDIAARVGVKYTVLYYYAPGGKEQLYVNVMERSLRRHQQGMEDAVRAAGPTLRDQLHAIVGWLMGQPPLNVARMQAVDFDEIGPEHARALSLLMFDALRLPVRRVLEAAQHDGQLRVVNLDLAAMMFIGLVQSVHGQDSNLTRLPADQVDPMTETDHQRIVAQMVDTLLYGWVTR